MAQAMSLQSGKLPAHFAGNLLAADEFGPPSGVPGLAVFPGEARLGPQWKAAGWTALAWRLLRWEQSSAGSGNPSRPPRVAFGRASLAEGLLPSHCAIDTARGRAIHPVPVHRVIDLPHEFSRRTVLFRFLSLMGLRPWGRTAQGLVVGGIHPGSAGGSPPVLE
jgi:hypothetical protein